MICNNNFTQIKDQTRNTARPLAATKVVQEDDMSVRFQNPYLELVLEEDGRCVLVDKRTGGICCVPEHGAPFAHIRKAGTEHEVSSVSCTDDLLTLGFGESEASVVVRVTARKMYFVWEVIAISDQEVEELAIVDVRLAPQGTEKEALAVCCLSLNLNTNVPDTPGIGNRVCAVCYRRFGIVGASAAIIGCPLEDLRAMIKDVVNNTPDLPKSTLGGPWALDAPMNRESYLFNFGGISAAQVDDWIELAHRLGFTQINFHGGGSFRFGDYQPNPKIYPEGRKSLKAVIDKLHEAGIAAGLHTYCHFIDKSCPWVTPVPDPRLGKDAVFKLDESMDRDTDVVRVVESTAGISTVTGFFVRNSVTLQIDKELVTFSGVEKTHPYRFTGCERGACGTRIEPHKKGTKVHHLKECFGLFVPDGDSSLLTEVAAATAACFNECGFDMFYFDAMDGLDVIGGSENSWHYGGKLIFELWKRLDRPALFEGNMMFPYYWYLCSRCGAWDHPVRGHKQFIDMHCVSNLEKEREQLLPTNLGWWSLLQWQGAQREPTYPDVVEYLCCKSLGHDRCLSMMGIDPHSVKEVPALSRAAELIRRYETLRRSGRVPEHVKSLLRETGKEFRLTEDDSGRSGFVPTQYTTHKFSVSDNMDISVRVTNRFDEQPVQLRIEALMSAAPYDAPENLVLADFGRAGEFTEYKTAENVEADLQWVSSPTMGNDTVGRFRAKNSGSASEGAWALARKRFVPSINITEQAQRDYVEGAARIEPGKGTKWVGMGLWIHGDGLGEVLNCQLRSPLAISPAVGDYYVIIDFLGWRYFKLIEPEAERFQQYRWPANGYDRWENDEEHNKDKSNGSGAIDACSPVIHGGFSFLNTWGIYRESVNHTQIETLTLWYNHLPQGREVTCCLSPIKALPLIANTIIHPVVTINGSTIVFPTVLMSGQHIECRGRNDCKLYDEKGTVISELSPRGDWPRLLRGENDLAFVCEHSGQLTPRVRVTVISEGEVLSATP